MAALAAALALAVAPGSALAADGDLDPSFDGDGRLISQVSAVDDRARDVAIDQQGRLVVVGTASNAGPQIALVARYNPDGSPDDSLGGDGEVVIEWTTQSESPESIAIDSQGRIVVGGYVNDGGPGTDFAVARLLPSGLPDDSFSGDGREIVDTGASLDIGQEVAIDAQGRVLLAGTTRQEGEEIVSLFRLTEQGEPDASFGAGGLAVADFGVDSFGSGLALDAQGRAVVSGSAADQFAAARFGTDGSLDSAFDGDGKVTLDFPLTNIESAGDVTIDPQGRIVLAGDGHNPVVDTVQIARLTPAGVPDAGFDGDGRAQLALPEPAYGLRVAVDPAGRILVAGELEGPSAMDALLARLQPSGAVDTSFGNGGFVREDYLAEEATASGLAIDSSGRYVIAGEATGGSSDGFGLARFQASYPKPFPVSITVEERLACAGQTATIEGTGKRDVLRGTGKRDVIVALGGNDQIRSLGGNDLVCAGSGRDFVQAGNGNDRVLAGAGPDRILGGAGRDTLLGEGGGDLLSGGPAADTMRGGVGRDEQRQ